MKIKGIKTGKSKGDVIELTPEDKLHEAVKMACSEGKHFPGYLTWVSSFEQKDLSFSSAGPLLRGMFANNTYKGSGEVTINFRSAAKDQIEPPKKLKVQVKFKDITDEWGMPELSITSSSFS